MALKDWKKTGKDMWKKVIEFDNKGNSKSSLNFKGKTFYVMK